MFRHTALFLNNKYWNFFKLQIYPGWHAQEKIKKIKNNLISLFERREKVNFFIVNLIPIIPEAVFLNISKSNGDFRVNIYYIYSEGQN